MRPKVNKLTLFGFVTIALIMFNSCEKDSTNNPIDGTWEFYMNCNKNLYRGCFFSINRDFVETLKIDGNSISKFYDDSLVYSNKITFSDTLIIYGQDVFAQEYILRNDTLKLIDTCFACDYNVYIKRK